MQAGDCRSGACHLPPKVNLKITWHANDIELMAAPLSAPCNTFVDVSNDSFSIASQRLTEIGSDREYETRGDNISNRF